MSPLCDKERCKERSNGAKDDERKPRLHSLSHRIFVPAAIENDFLWIIVHSIVPNSRAMRTMSAIIMTLNVMTAAPPSTPKKSERRFPDLMVQLYVILRLIALTETVSHSNHDVSSHEAVNGYTLCPHAVTLCSLSGILFTVTKLALPEGFEPTTREVEARCSIQLSYGSMRHFLIKDAFFALHEQCP